MRAALCFFTIAACSSHHPSDPEPAPTPVQVTPPQPAIVEDVRAKKEPIGALAAQPAPPTPDAVKHRSCAGGAPVDLGETDRSNVAVAFGATSGIVAWSPNEHQLAIRPIDRAGKPLGEAHLVDAPARVASAFGIRALDGHYLVFLSDTDFTGSSPILKLYAVLTDADGKPSAPVKRVAIGERGTIDSISPGGAHGVLVWAGPTPATQITKGRLITLAVTASGALAQSFIEIRDPAPNDRANAFFSLGPHAVTLIGADVIVDGEIKPRKDAATYKPDGLELAPTFTGSAVPVVGFGLGKDAKTLRYGTLGLDGVFHFDGADVAMSKPLHAPFVDRVTWGTSTASTGVEVFGMIDIRGGDIPPVKLPPELAGAGFQTEVVWSGDQVLIVVADGHKVRIAPLPCT